MKHYVAEVVVRRCDEPRGADLPVNSQGFLQKRTGRIIIAFVTGQVAKAVEGEPESPAVANLAELVYAGLKQPLSLREVALDLRHVAHIVESERLVPLVIGFLGDAKGLLRCSLHPVVIPLAPGENRHPIQGARPPRGRAGGGGGGEGLEQTRT